MAGIAQIVAGPRWSYRRIAMWGLAAVAAAVLSADTRGAILSMMLAAPWLLSAWLFRKASRQRD